MTRLSGPSCQLGMPARWYIGSYNRSSSNCKSDSTTGLADSVISSLRNHGLTQLQLEPTYKDRVLDLFCSNKPSLIKSVSTIPEFSDHSFVVIDTVLKPVISKKPPRKIYRWARANWDAMKQKTLAFSEKIKGTPFCSLATYKTTCLTPQKRTSTRSHSGGT